LKTVSRFEARLLRLTEFFVGRANAAASAHFLVGEEEEPFCLSRDAVEALQDRLAKGIVEALVREGGWRREAYLREGAAREGAVWQRTAPERLGLGLTGQSMRFLLWATARDAQGQNAGWEQDDAPRSLGDDVLLFLAYRAVREGTVAARLETLLTSWRRLSPFRRNALIQLLYPLDSLTEDEEAIDFAPWFEPSAAAVLECLQRTIATEWIDLERRRREIRNAVEMRHAAGRIETTLRLYLDAAERAGRRDLARCLLSAMRRWSREPAEALRWSPQLDVSEFRLAERLRHRSEALAFPRAFLRAATWFDRARATSIVDDDYPAARLLRSEWERHAGDESRRFAERLIQDAERGVEAAS
jgi:hypothetical protein